MLTNINNIYNTTYPLIFNFKCSLIITAITKSCHNDQKS